MQPKARRVGAARMHRLLQTEQDTAKPWRETGGEPPRVVALVQCPQSLLPVSVTAYMEPFDVRLNGATTKVLT